MGTSITFDAIATPSVTRVELINVRPAAPHLPEYADLPVPEFRLARHGEVSYTALFDDDWLSFVLSPDGIAIPRFCHPDDVEDFTTALNTPAARALIEEARARAYVVDRIELNYFRGEIWYTAYFDDDDFYLDFVLSPGGLAILTDKFEGFSRKEIQAFEAALRTPAARSLIEKAGAAWNPTPAEIEAVYYNTADYLTLPEPWATRLTEREAAHNEEIKKINAEYDAAYRRKQNFEALNDTLSRVPTLAHRARLMRAKRDADNLMRLLRIVQGKK